MKRWTVFEAGSRAGLSARMFFDDYKRKFKTDDTLLMVDGDLDVIDALDNTKGNGVYMSLQWRECIKHPDAVVFPADELTRQQAIDVNEYNIARMWFNDVSPKYYNKQHVNDMLSHFGVNVPKTFDVEDVFIKPNTMSAGSRGLMQYDNVCVQQRLDIDTEYVVDATVDEDGTVLGIVARATRLRAGYDKLIKFVPYDHPATQFALDVIKNCPSMMFRGVCHLQIAETREKGHPFYYIEGSKRISGTSLVNLAVGYNPFVLLHERKPMPRPEEHACFDSLWHTYEEMLTRVNKQIYDEKC